MADEQGNGAATNGAAKSKTEYEAIAMKDGRTVNFAGKRKIDKTITLSEGDVEVRFDLRNGATLSLKASELGKDTNLQLIGHGIAQKVGDEAAGTEKIDDIELALSEMIDRLKKGDWTQARAVGDGFSGASIVIKAVCEVTGKSVEEIKAFLNKKLEDAKAKGEKLTRADLYASFRNPASKTGAVITRLEAEERAKASKADANELLAEIG